MAAKRTPLEASRARAEIARNNLAAAKAKRQLARVKGTDPQGNYQVLEPNKERRQPSVERTGEDGILPQNKRLKSAALGRDIERNFSPGRGIIHQFRVNVVGHLGKIQVNCENGTEATEYFNSDWAPAADFRNDDHFTTLLQNDVASVLREGDFLLLVDDGIIEDSGKLLSWEADQIAPLSKTALAASPYKDATQDNGILRDKYGRELAYVSSGEHGLQSISDLDKATIYPRGEARLVRNPWRLNQGRGVASILTAAAQIQDLYEILMRELQTAKRAASQAGYTKRSDAVTDYDNAGEAPAFLPEGSGKDTATTDAEGANASSNAPRNYENLESFATFWDYVDKDDEIHILDFQRPNVHLAEFIEAVMGMSGASMGLARVYTSLKASTSYTAFRGEMLLSWATFYAMQKWLERTVADWVAIKVLRRAQRLALIKTLPEGWERSISWAWPTMPTVDPLKEASATRIKLKNGTINYAELLGPNWEKLFESFAAQIDKARELNLPLSVLESMSGNLPEPEPDDDDETKPGGGKDE